MLDRSTLHSANINKWAIALLLLMCACAVGPDYEAKKWDVNDKYHADAIDHVNQEEVRLDWWKVFDDEVLNELIDEAVKHNHDIKIALSNMEEAKALRRESIGGFFPSVKASQNSTKEKFSDKVSNVSAGERDVFSSDLDASWELDLFGKKRRNLEAAKARLQASQENKNAVLLAVIAEVSRNYFEVRGLQKRIDVLEDNLAILNKVEDLAQKQFKGGMVTEFDISRARGERQETQAKLPDLKADMQAGIYRISVLSGKTPEYYLKKLLKKMTLPSPPDVVPVGLRSDILRRRPDIKTAEREVAAATADIGVQTAELFPSISLTGAIGTSAGLFGDLFGPGAGTFTAGSLVKWSLFEGGAIRARISAAKATSKTALYQYEKTVLVALEDVETSLLRYGNEWQKLKQLREAGKTRQKGFDLAELRYKAGEADFIVILDAERSLVGIKDEVIQSETRMLTNLTKLYKSLGGGWEPYAEASEKKTK